MIMTLVRKDLMYFTKSLKSTFLITILLSFGMSMVNISFGLAIPALVCYIGFYSLLAYEERSKMNLLTIALPVTRQQICLSKYSEMLVFIFGSTLLSLSGMCIHQLTGTSKMLAASDYLYTLMPIMIGGALVYAAIMMPCIFHFGIIKARYVMLVMYIGIFSVASSMGNGNNIMIIMKQMSQIRSDILGMGVLGIGIVMFIISYLISLKIWCKKDF